MSITFTPAFAGKGIERVSRNIGAVSGTLTIAGPYTPGAGGLTLPTTLTRYFKPISGATIPAIAAIEFGNQHYDPRLSLEFLPSTNFVKVFRDAPPVVCEEVIAVAAGTTATLNYPPAYVNYVCGGAADYATPYSIIASGAGAANVQAGQVHINMTTGVMTFNTAAPALIKVSYITKAAKVFSDNLVDSEVHSLEATGGTALANTAVAIQCVTDIETPAAPAALNLITSGSDAVANGEAEITWASTKITAEATQDEHAGLVTYIKTDTDYLANRQVLDESDGVAGADITETDLPVLALSTAGFLVFSDKASQQIIGKGETPGANECCLLFGTIGYGYIGSGLPCQFTLKSDLDPTNGLHNYIHGYPHELEVQKIEPYIASGTIWTGTVTALGMIGGNQR